MKEYFQSPALLSFVRISQRVKVDKALVIEVIERPKT